MNCTQARDILNEVLDRESPDKEPLAREHLRTCAACRRWWDLLDTTARLLADASESPFPPDIAAAVMARLPERHPASDRAGAGRPMLAGLAWVAGAWLLGAAALAACFALAGGWTALPGAIQQGFVLGRAAETLAATLLVRLAECLASMGLAAKVLQNLGPYVAMAAVAEVCLVAAVAAALCRRRGRVVIRCF